MKKILAVILSLAMILSMTVCAFANTETETGVVTTGEGEVTTELTRPADAHDEAAWTAYYTALLDKAMTQPGELFGVIEEISATKDEGAVASDVFNTAFMAAIGATGGDTVNQILWGVETLTGSDINGDTFVGKPTAVPPAVDDGTEDDGSTDDGSTDDGATDDGSTGSDSLLGGFDISGLFDTVLGVVGGLFDSLLGGLLGGDSGTGDEGEEDEEGDMWGDDGDAWGDEGSSDAGDDFNDSSLGDTSVIAVAAVALAAGAALVLTRKKSEDAE